MENHDSKMWNRISAMLKMHISTVVTVLVEHVAMSLKALCASLEQRMGLDLSRCAKQLRHTVEHVAQEATSSMTTGFNLNRLSTQSLLSSVTSDFGSRAGLMSGARIAAADSCSSALIMGTLLFAPEGGKDPEVISPYLTICTDHYTRFLQFLLDPKNLVSIINTSVSMFLSILLSPTPTHTRESLPVS